MTTSIRSFSEREFYLGEFRGRSIGVAWPAEEAPRPEPLAAVLSELTRNGSRVVLISPNPAVFSGAGIADPVNGQASNPGPQLWRALATTGRAGLRVQETSFESEVCRSALDLRLAKVVWVQSKPPVERVGGEGRISVVDLAHLAALVPDGAATGASAMTRGRVQSRELLRAIRALIEGGVPSVNVCAAEDLERELFTYAGAGIFFTKERYADVRPLALDDYDLANDLIARGEADGFLAPRDAAARDAVLAGGVGVFIEGRYLAGIGALLPYPEAQALEVACLFALTRYEGEGAGGQIVRYAIEQAQRRDIDFLFCCTTSERVQRFFERQGFRCVAQDEIPKAKWHDYDPARRAIVQCMRFDCSAA